MWESISGITDLTAAGDDIEPLEDFGVIGGFNRDFSHGTGEPLLLS